MTNKPFSIKTRLKSFKYAFNGLSILIKEEHNSRVHLIAALLVIIAGFYFKISSYEWISLTIVITLVITMEIVNSALENLCDFVSPEKHLLIKKIKDLAAASVLLSAFSALIVGLIIFIPKIKILFF